ncbi:MAG: pyridoxamine 5'-phosphate oxidase family protein [Peptococcaceae bacterium]|nr:pyridoxamine 5'-phosphate oxidase family protein [Peptococcaceae bacterium]
MVINEGIKAVIEGSAFLTLVTVGPDGVPHPIITGKGEVMGDTVIFGIYKMEKTQKNLAANNSAWVVAATKDGGPKGYRLSGTAEAKGKQLIFTPVKADPLI